jgi:hypothetical protein|tara:strand:+ start:411 stop:728 length:318 start_codon:yes stop_codon:yes gene_type:complete
MKEKVLIMIIGVLVIGLAFAITKETPVVDKITVTYGEPKKKEIAVNVTLTKYQLSKMLEILEEENSYGRPADPQDTYTFYSVAKNLADSEEYNISSTHLAKRLNK